MSIISMKMNLQAEDISIFMNGFAQRLVLSQRRKVTRKWPIEQGYHKHSIEWVVPVTAEEEINKSKPL